MYVCRVIGIGLRGYKCRFAGFIGVDSRVISLHSYKHRFAGL